MQIEGADVFLGAFAMLKRFDFFNEISNWFIPFYKENKVVTQSLNNLKENLDVSQFSEGLERTTFMCNSDKYSFCLNVQYLPDEQKHGSDLFAMELKAMNEIADDEGLVNTSARNKAIIGQYFQDLYRFHKLHPVKNEFTDIFAMDFNIYNAEFFKVIVEDKSILRNIAELFFEKGYYRESLNLFLGCDLVEKNFELFEKVAFCYQQLGDLQNALIYYKKAELLEKNRLWILNKIAWCYRKLKEYKKAYEVYLEAEKINPDELQIQVMLGQTCIELEDFEKALNYFYKVEYLSPDNFKVLRPIAWCSFVLGKLESAKKYAEKIMAKKVHVTTM
ncbi:MAG: tetratricopeptide repeat protein [Bacteroidales bacterium]|nr:tetratricopeptide repeat protein [Bacteroidales bacterium]